MKYNTRKNTAKKAKTNSKFDHNTEDQSETVKSTKVSVSKKAKQKDYAIQNTRKRIREKKSWAPPAFVLPSDTLGSEILAITQGQSETPESSATTSFKTKVEKMSTKYREMLLQQIHDEAIRKRIQDEHGVRRSSVANDEALITFRTNNSQDDFAESKFSFYNTYPLFAVDVPPPTNKLRTETELSKNSVDEEAQDADTEDNAVEKEATIRGVLSALRVSTHQMRALVQVQSGNLNEYHEETKRRLRTMQSVFSEALLPINSQLHSENMKFLEQQLRQKRLPANFA